MFRSLLLTHHHLQADFELTALFQSNLLTSSLLPLPVNLTNQDVDTEYSEAGHTPTETDYYYEETAQLPEGEVFGQEEIPAQVKEKKTLISDTGQRGNPRKKGKADQTRNESPNCLIDLQNQRNIKSE